MPPKNRSCRDPTSCLTTPESQLIKMSHGPDEEDESKQTDIEDTQFFSLSALDIRHTIRSLKNRVLRSRARRDLN